MLHLVPETSPPISSVAVRSGFIVAFADYRDAIFGSEGYNQIKFYCFAL